jgi:hypothetical protein
MNCIAGSNPIYRKWAASGMQEMLNSKRERNRRRIAELSQRFWLLE